MQTGPWYRINGLYLLVPHSLWFQVNASLKDCLIDRPCKVMREWDPTSLNTYFEVVVPVNFCITRMAEARGQLRMSGFKPIRQHPKIAHIHVINRMIIKVDRTKFYIISWKFDVQILFYNHYQWRSVRVFMVFSEYPIIFRTKILICIISR